MIGRNGGAGADATLTVLGHSNDAAHTSFQFDTSFAVAASFANSKVVRRGYPIAFDLDDVNVGQRVRVFGALSGTNLDATGASAVLRMQPTRVYGHAAGAPSAGALEIALSRVDLRPQTAFAWNRVRGDLARPGALRARRRRARQRARHRRGHAGRSDGLLPARGRRGRGLRRARAREPRGRAVAAPAQGQAPRHGRRHGGDPELDPVHVDGRACARRARARRPGLRGCAAAPELARADRRARGRDHAVRAARSRPGHGPRVPELRRVLERGSR